MRMGTLDKATLVWGQQRFIDRQYQCLRSQLPAVWINRRGDHPSALPLPGPLCVDLLPGQGPLAGIHAGLTRLARPWLLVVPCDAPMLAPSLFDILATAPAGPMRYAHDGERAQYLFALLHVSVLPGLNQYLRTDGRAVRDWYAMENASAIDCTAIRSSFTNINTTDDYRALVARDRKPDQPVP